MMLSDWLLADDIKDRIDEIVLDPAYPVIEHDGHVHVYSGPHRLVTKQLIGIAKNHDRALIWAPKHGAMLLDETRVGKFLINFQGFGSATIADKGTFKYFAANPRVTDPTEKDNQAMEPWRHASVLFALGAWGHVTTTVCGAAPDGVYCSLETSHLINSYHKGFPLKDIVRALFVPRHKPIEAFNLVPYARIADGYTPTNWEPATKLIARSEQRMALQEALHGVNPKTIRDALKLASKEVLLHPVEAYEYFLESRECYEVDREIMVKATTARPRKTSKPPVERLKIRERRLEEFGAMALALVQAELDLMPAASRPSIIVPTCCIIRATRP